jgi:hypothetical protein
MQALTDAVKRRWPGVVIYGIGDEAHKLHPSDHNEDDTPGSMAAQSDADNNPEHRAIDVMLGPAFTKQDGDELVSNLLRDPAARARLQNVIWYGHIWSRSWGWTRRDYTGSDPHTNHPHISGWAGDDENAADWPAVEGDDMFGDDDAARLANVERMLNKVMKGSLDPGPAGTPENAITWWLRSLANASDPLLAERFPGWKPIPVGLLQLSQRQDALVTEVAALRAVVEGLAETIRSGGGSVDSTVILAGVDRAVAGAVAALTAETRDAVADLGEGGAAQVRADA